MAPPWDRYGVRARRVPEDSREGWLLQASRESPHSWNDLSRGSQWRTKTRPVRTAAGIYHRMCAARMRFSVVLRAQNALFREGLQPECVFSYLGKRGAALRKSTFCIHRLTEKRTLAPAASPKTTFWTSCARSMTYICACTTTPISKSPRTTRASSADRVGWDSRKAIRTVRCRSPRRRPHPLSSLILST